MTMTHRKQKHTEEAFEVRDEAVEPEEEAGAGDARLETEPLREQLELKTKQVAEMQDLYLRALADFNNYKKRHAERFDEQINAANQELILKLLPVMDNFERALAAARESESFAALAEGVEMTLRQMQGILTAEGVEPIPTVGKSFDPALHEAVMSVATDEAPDHTILDEFEKGYTYRSKVIRPAKVRVAVSL